MSDASSILCAVPRPHHHCHTTPTPTPIPTQHHTAPRDSDREVIEKLVERDDSIYFRAPVKKSAYPKYYTKIKKPIDLRTIQSKITSFE